MNSLVSIWRAHQAYTHKSQRKKMNLLHFKPIENVKYNSDKKNTHRNIKPLV